MAPAARLSCISAPSSSANLESSATRSTNLTPPRDTNSLGTRKQELQLPFYAPASHSRFHLLLFIYSQGGFLPTTPESTTV
eukprot:scaffold145882_cov26-Tisochrysis_lutea.AAC.1